MTINDVIQKGLSDLDLAARFDRNVELQTDDEGAYNLTDVQGDTAFTWVPPAAVPIGNNTFGIAHLDDDGETVSGRSCGASPIPFGLRVIPLNRPEVGASFITLSKPQPNIATVKAMKVNPMCSYALLQCTNALFCCRLPPRNMECAPGSPPFLGAGMEPICIGRRLHKNLPHVTIRSAQWHTLSRHGGHVLVLTSDGYVRLYNLARVLRDEYTKQAYIDECEMEVAVCTGNDTRSVVSMSLPTTGKVTASRGWASMAARVLLSDGSITTLCPVVPKDCNLCWDDVLQMQEGIAELSELQQNPSTQRKLAITSAWVDKLAEQLTQADGESSDDHTLQCLTAPALRSPVQRVEARPSGNVDSAQELGEPCSLFVPSESPLVCVVGYKSGEIRVLMSVTPLCGLWGTEVKTDDIFTMERILVGNSAVSLYEDQIHHDRFFAANEHGVFRIVLPNMCAIVNSLTGVDNLPLQSSINHILVIMQNPDSATGSAVAGLATVAGEGAGYMLLVVKRDGDVITHSLHHVVSKGTAVGKGANKFSPDAASSKVSDFDRVVEDRLRANELPVYRSDLTSDRDRLEFLTGYMQRVRSEYIKNFYPVGQLIHTQKEQGKLLIAQQANDVRATENEIDSALRQIGATRERLSGVESKVRSLLNDLNETVEIHNSRAQGALLSDAEKKYMAELVRVNERLSVHVLPKTDSMLDRADDIADTMEDIRGTDDQDSAVLDGPAIRDEMALLGERIDHLTGKTRDLSLQYLNEVELGV
ncbi:hypothetical protein SARC_00360 [Sphaeroforma arctica JP610]|uniref:Uncharacterized protein n=1 Tax=Sphaeroforma arctica JP610 TaxID=667725 RepID=A0A0L0GF96_9EUKA|nr:hypothetical protein SARC_00360 [Sphaeroforma arctica JP610]KNC87536.1 hypothetical protein SARC_00360 [Sphaeroforma arctica JP610]|eukprot:XP_014161438.1 hypothetical protein SARC_00360 [Sphaeroforma arctica JP610]